MSRRLKNTMSMTDEERLAAKFIVALAELSDITVENPKRSISQHWAAMSPDDQVSALKVFRGARAWFQEYAP